jgi:hypothetical protein
LPELKVFLGLQLLMGVVKLPKLQDYWSDRIPLVTFSFSNHMTRDRFRAINSGLQVLDRSRDNEWEALEEYQDLGTYWKIGDYMKRWRARVTNMVSPGRNVTIDETVIKSWVKTKNHVRLKHKPAGSGSQRQTLHTPEGNLVWIIFPGNRPPLAPGENKTMQQVKELLEHVPEGTRIAADNYFHFVPLLEWAHSEGKLLYGTFRQDRLPSPAVKTWLLAVPEKHQWRALHKGEVHLYSWWDSKKALFISNFPAGGAETVERWVKGQDARQEVAAPLVAKLYNQNKVGADTADLRRSTYGDLRPNPKWTHAWLQYTIEEAESQCYLVFNRFIPPLGQMDHESFRLQLVRELLRAPEAAIPRARAGPELAYPKPKRRYFSLDSLPPTRLVGQHPLAYVTTGRDSPDQRRPCKLCKLVDKKKIKTDSYCGNPDCLVFLCTKRAHWNQWHTEEVISRPGN